MAAQDSLPRYIDNGWNLVDAGEFDKIEWQWATEEEVRELGFRALPAEERAMVGLDEPDAVWPTPSCWPGDASAHPTVQADVSNTVK